MKKSLLIILLLVIYCLHCKAQNYTYEYSGNPYRYEGIINCDSLLKKDQLYSKALEWFAVTFNDSKAVLRVQDKESGILIGKGDFSWTYQYPSKLVGPNIGYVYFTIKINTKDSKIKYELFDFNTEGYGIIKDGTITKYPDVKIPFSSGKKYKEVALDAFKKLQNQTETNAKSIINALTAAVLKPTTSNW